VAPLQEAVRSHPSTPAPYIDLAYALDSQGQSAEAAGYLKTAVTLVPADNSDKDSFRGKHDLLLRHIYLDLGAVSLRAHQDAEAVQAYRQAESLNGRVKSQVASDSRDRMDARLRDYLDEDEPRIYAALGAALRGNAQYKDAIAAAEQATTLRPSNGAYWRGLAEAYQSAAVHGKPGEPETTQMWVQSAGAYAKALPTFPNDATLHDRYGIALSEAGRHAEAVKEFQTADTLRPADAKPSATVLFHYGVSEWQLGNTTHATALFQQSGQTDPQRSQTLQWQGFASLRTLDPRAAIDPLIKAAQIDPNSVATHLDLGTAYVQTGQPDLALPQFQKVVELQPDSLEGNYALGRTLFDLMRFAEAAKAFRRADDLFVNHDSVRPVVLYGKGDPKLTRSEIQHALGYSLELAGDLAGAADVHESASAGGTNSEMVRYAAWERYLLATREPTAANWDRAERALGRAARLQPTRTILDRSGDTLSYQKKYSEAAPQYARAVEIGLAEPHSGTSDPEKSVYALREKYAGTLRTLGRDDEAIVQLEAAVPRDTEPYNPLVVLGALYQKQASVAAAHVDKQARDTWNAKAEAVYLKALDVTVPPVAPNSPATPPKLQIRKALAPIQYSLGKYDEAGNTAVEVLKEDPADLNTAIIRYKYLYERKGDGDAARMALEDALQHAPSSASANKDDLLTADRAVAFQYLRHSPRSASDLHQAGEFYNRALELQPKDTESLNGKGVIAMQRKQYTEAVDQFKLAVAADPHNGAAYNNLGEAYEHLKGDHFSDTLQSYRRAYQENPNLSAARLNLARYTKYAKFGWESRDHLASYDSIPVYHRRAQPAPRKHRRHR
jgi:tetratricopeptide (TPR) repeat protein